MAFKCPKCGKFIEDVIKIGYGNEKGTCQDCGEEFIAIFSGYVKTRDGFEQITECWNTSQGTYREMLENGDSDKIESLERRIALIEETLRVQDSSIRTQNSSLVDLNESLKIIRDSINLQCDTINKMYDMYNELKNMCDKKK